MSDYFYILGVPNFANYESSCSLLKLPKENGKIEYVSIGEDRLTRIKNSYTFPLRGIDYCLNHFGLKGLDQIDIMVTDFARTPRWHNSGQAYQKLEHDYLKLKLNFPTDRIHIVDHHDAHAASCFYPSGFDEAGVLIVDGMGSELNTQSGYHFEGSNITWQEKGYDWGVGRLYSLVTGSILPYGPEKGFGKVMGLAAYGENSKPSEVNMRGKINGMTSDYSEFFSRYPISRLKDPNIPVCDDRQAVMQHPFPAIAYETQQECERVLIEFAKYIHNKTGSKNLCIAGGVALNGRANYRILKETPIENIWIQPACSDCGISLGLAMWGAYKLIKKENTFKNNKIIMNHAYGGTTYPKTRIESILNKYEIKYKIQSPKKVSQLISKGKIIAVFEKNSEIGPRALGHRSILADPRNKKMKDKLNSSIKFREGYRPYAPVVLREFVSDYFDLDCDSPFMLLVADVNKNKRDVIPSVTHIDGTARVQTVTEKDNGIYYNIINEFNKITGVPVLLNTSFNVNREPIVETPEDALICALGTSIDYLYIDERLIDCSNYRDPSIVTKITKDRNLKLIQDYEKIKNKYLYDFNDNEMKIYLKEENQIAEWHRKYSSKYELEKLIEEWSIKNKSILIIGERSHTDCLYMYINGFPSIDFKGHLDFPLKEKKNINHNPIKDISLNDINWNEIEEIFISSHEYQRQIIDWINKNVEHEIEIKKIYDYANDDMQFVLPGKWPVINEYESRKNSVKINFQDKKIVSNIDFDFEPSSIGSHERYGVAINYHYVRSQSTELMQIGNYVKTESFNEQIRQLNENFSFSRCSEFLDKESNLDESSILVTFDDGAKELAFVASEVLARYDVKSTFFICSSPYLDNKVLKVHKIQILMRRLGYENFYKKFYTALKEKNILKLKRESIEYADGFNFYRYDTEETKKFKLDLNYTIPYIYSDDIINKIFDKEFNNESEKQLVKKIYLSKDEIKKLIDDGHEIGSHSHDHKVLPRLSYQEQKEDLEKSFDFINSLTGNKRHCVAYPYGFNNQQTEKILEEFNMLGGFDMSRKLIKPKDNLQKWSLPRYDVNDCFSKQTNDINYEIFADLSTGD